MELNKVWKRKPIFNAMEESAAKTCSPFPNFNSTSGNCFFAEDWATKEKVAKRRIVKTPEIWSENFFIT